MHPQESPRRERVLVTGAAGFIGAHLTLRLLEEGVDVTGVDDLNDYYDPALKRARLDWIRRRARRGGSNGVDGRSDAQSRRARTASGAGRFTFHRLDLADRAGARALFADEDFGRVVHLAAQAGVRYSLENPHKYVDANLVAFVNVLEGCRDGGVEHLVFASSSSVFGANTRQPYRVTDTVDHPVSLYAATKKSGELLAHSYAALYGLPCTGLRYFTVYGPWGRPDMAYFKFADRITSGRPIEVYNRGEMWRDFTFVDDVVEGTVRVLGTLPGPDPEWSGDDPDPATSFAPYRVYNIGHGQPVKLTRFIELLEEALGRRAEKELLPMQPGDVPSTHADVSGLERAVGYRPRVPLEQGIPRFVDWYREWRSARGGARASASG